MKERAPSCSAPALLLVLTVILQLLLLAEPSEARGGVKGQRTARNPTGRRDLQEKIPVKSDPKKHGLIHAFDQVWVDASGLKKSTATLETKCIKPPKSPKSSDGAGDAAEAGTGTVTTSSTGSDMDTSSDSAAATTTSTSYVGQGRRQIQQNSTGGEVIMGYTDYGNGTVTPTGTVVTTGVGGASGTGYSSGKGSSYSGAGAGSSSGKAGSSKIGAGVAGGAGALPYCQDDMVGGVGGAGGSYGKGGSSKGTGSGAGGSGNGSSGSSGGGSGSSGGGSGPTGPTAGGTGGTPAAWPTASGVGGSPMATPTTIGTGGIGVSPEAYPTGGGSIAIPTAGTAGGTGSSPVATSTAVGSPIATSGGSGAIETPTPGATGEIATPTPGGSGAIATPTPGATGEIATPTSGGTGEIATPTAGGTGESPAAGPTLSVCEAFASGKASVSGVSKLYQVGMALTIDKTVPEESILGNVTTVLNTNVSPFLLGCSNNRQLRRFLQSTKLTNIVFSQPRRNQTASCTATVADALCAPIVIRSEVFYYGDSPVGFEDLLRQAILMQPFNVTGLLGLGNLVVTEGTGTLTSSPTASPGEGDGNRDPGVSSINASAEDKSVNPGAFVAAALAGLTLVFLALFVAKRRRDSDESLSKHRELQDDEDLGLTTDDDDTLQNREAIPPRKSYVVGEGDSVQSWDSQPVPDHDGQEVYAASPVMDYQHSPHHMCSSPNCELCEQKRQQGTRFIMADSGKDQHMSFIPSEENDRDYEHDDTVDL